MKLFSKSEDNILQKKGYTLGDVLGKGSYATVKKATRKKADDVDPEHLAMKIIALNEVQEEFKQKFLKREISISRILNHPNVIKTIEVIESNNRIYLPIELASRGDLLEYIQLRGPLKDPQIADLFGQLCCGVQYLHLKNIIHRDLKCDNVLLNNDNVVKLADFGFARRQRLSDLSETYCGSAAYAAPELLRGIPYRGPPVDVWSLGVILFTMACAMMPFRDGHIKTLMADQMQPLHYPRRLDNSLNPLLKDLMQGLLNYDVEKRYTLQDIATHDWTKETNNASEDPGQSNKIQEV